MPNLFLLIWFRAGNYYSYFFRSANSHEICLSSIKILLKKCLKVATSGRTALIPVQNLKNLSPPFRTTGQIQYQSFLI